MLLWVFCKCQRIYKVTTTDNLVYWCLINDSLKRQPRRSGDVWEKMELLRTCPLCHGAPSAKCCFQGALWNMCLSFHRELKEKIQPEILELIKQQRLNRLVEGTCFRKLNCRRRQARENSGLLPKESHGYGCWFKGRLSSIVLRTRIAVTYSR